MLCLLLPALYCSYKLGKRNKVLEIELFNLFEHLPILSFWGMKKSRAFDLSAWEQLKLGGP